MRENDRFTVLVVPEGDGGKVRRFEVSRRLIASAGGALFLAAAVLIAGVVGFGVGLMSSAERSRLQAQNEAYQLRLQRAEEGLATLSAQLETLRETEARLKQLTNYPEPANTRTSPSSAKAPAGSAPSADDILGLGGRGGIEAGPMDHLSPNAGLFVDVPLNPDAPAAPLADAPVPAVDLLARLEGLVTEMSGATESLALLEKHISEKHDTLRRKPSISPVRNGWISSPFGSRTSPFTGMSQFHDGLDFTADIGEPVYATADGLVVFASNYNGMGKTVEIDHGDGIRTRYGHNSTLLVRVGQKVRRGDVISKVGMTGNTTGPHVHYEVLRNGRPVNPASYLATE